MRRAVRQLKVEQVVAAVVQVETLGARVRADEDHVLLAAKTGSQLGASLVRVFAGDGQDLPGEFAARAGAAERGGHDRQARGVLGVDQDVGARRCAADRMDLGDQHRHLRIAGFSRGGQLHQAAQLAFPALEHGQAALLAPAAALHVVDVVTDQHELSRDVLRLECVAILRLLV